MSISIAIAVPHPPLIVPAVGRGEEARIQDTIDAYREAAQAVVAAEPDCIVITSPHAPMFRDAFHITTGERLEGSMAQFRAPQERLEARCDNELAEAIMQAANDAGIFAVTRARYGATMDHATYVPLYFIREAYHVAVPDAVNDVPCPIVRIGLSGFSYETHRALGGIIARTAETLGRRIAFVASGDLSHKLLAEGPYGFAPEGPVFDERIGQIFSSGDLEGLFAFDEAFCDAAAECGLRSFQIMAGAIAGCGFESRLLSNEGPFGVGYAVAILAPGNDSEEPIRSEEADQADPIVALARLSVETYVKTGRPAQLPDGLPDQMTQRAAGVFVSLHSHGMLRGCIGTIAATTESIAREIIQNGISACSRDPRFNPVRPDELDDLEYSVDVLGDAEPIASVAELDPIRYGVIVTKGWRRGLLLPNLDGVDTVEEQVAIAKQKAGISVRDDDVDLERFEVVRHTRGGEPRSSVR